MNHWQFLYFILTSYIYMYICMYTTFNSYMILLVYIGLGASTLQPNAAIEDLGTCWERPGGGACRRLNPVHSPIGQLNVICSGFPPNHHITGTIPQRWPPFSRYTNPNLKLSDKAVICLIYGPHDTCIHGLRPKSEVRPAKPYPRELHHHAPEGQKVLLHRCRFPRPPK